MSSSNGTQQKIDYSSLGVESYADFAKLPIDYDPLLDNGSYMNPRHLAYFYKMLIDQRAQVYNETNELRLSCKDLVEDMRSADEFDQAASQTNLDLFVKKIERNTKLLRKIGGSIENIQNGVYGICKSTNKPIGLARLQARPVATLSIEAQNDEDTHEMHAGDFNSDDMQVESDLLNALKDNDNDNDNTPPNIL